MKTESSSRKMCGGAVAVVDVGIDDHGFLDEAIGLQAANGHGDVVNGAETFAVIGVSVMEAAAEIRMPKPSRSASCAARIVPPAASQTASASSGEYGTSSFMISLAVSVPVFNLCDPVVQCGRAGGLRRRRGSGCRKSVIGGDVFRSSEFVGNQAEFLRGENVRAEIQVVARDGKRALNGSMASSLRRLVFAIENEIRKGHQSARAIFGIGCAVEAGFGAAGVIVGQFASAIERAGIVDQRDDGFRAHAE